MCTAMPSADVCCCQVALSDTALLREMLLPLPDFSDPIQTANATAAFYVRRKPLSATVNTLANALYAVRTGTAASFMLRSEPCQSIAFLDISLLTVDAWWGCLPDSEEGPGQSHHKVSQPLLTPAACIGCLMEVWLNTSDWLLRRPVLPELYRTLHMPHGSHCSASADFKAVL